MIKDPEGLNINGRNLGNHQRYTQAINLGLEGIGHNRSIFLKFTTMAMYSL